MKCYQDPTRPVQERVEDLLGRMSLQEKVGQLNQRLYGFAAYEREGDTITLTEETVREAERFQGLGVVYGLYRADPWSGRTEETGLTGRLAARAYNLLQRCAIEHSPHGIPMLLSSECPHGHQALSGYLLPVNLAVGATFDPQLFEQAASVAGKQLKAMGVNLALVSMLDVLRDPRWGRSEECFGEDPYLCSRFAEAAVKGIQKEGVPVVAKHFCAQGEGTGGVNASAARIGERELREIHLPPARAAVRAGAKGIMAAYNEIDGVYCHVNKKLLTDTLRGEFGFEGIVVADGMALNRLREMTGDDVLSSKLAIEAGVDVSLWDQVFPRLTEAVESGVLKEEVIDRAVRRVLTLKFEQGLFENPYLPETEEWSTYTPKNYPETEELARASAVLLKNSGVLPFSASVKRIVVLGPNADDIYRQLGDYTPPVSEEESSTLLSGLRKLSGERKVTSVPYGPLTEEKKAELQKLCGEADVIVMALGGSSSRYEGAVFDDNGAAVVKGELKMDCGEGMDVSNLSLPGDQDAWFHLAEQSGKPVVTVLIGGRPYAAAKIEEKSAAVLTCFYPGPMGGIAIAKLLYGEDSPSGRLPVSVPASAGALPAYYNPKKSYDAMKYCDGNRKPLHCFGDGIGYGKIVYGPMELTVDREASSVTIRVEAKNEGERADYAVPQIYLHDIKASTVRRVRELKAFQKERLAPGERKNMTLTLSREAFLLWNPSMEEVLEPGEFEVTLRDRGQDWDQKIILL